MNGRTDLFRPRLEAVLQSEVRKRSGVRAFLRGIMSQQGCEATVTTTGPQGSGILRSMDLANCLIDIPEEVERLYAGDTVQVLAL
jgi:molybdopterin molybdotransferase